MRGRVVELGDLGAVVPVPVAVLVGEGKVANQRPEGVLVKGTARGMRSVECH